MFALELDFVYAPKFDFQQIFAFCNTLRPYVEELWQKRLEWKNAGHNFDLWKNTFAIAVDAVPHKVQHAAGKLPSPHVTVEYFARVLVVVLDHDIRDGVRAVLYERV